ncbi:MAG: DUF1318 domain-containing protein [Planctomycetota bacterium]|nr:DUF1318 domain-containing protein [Planctomycetota bacterium]
MNHFGKLIVMLMFIPLAGCKNLAQIDVSVIDERTQLENQVLGAYEDISEDLVLIASVRGVSEEGEMRVPPPQSTGKKRALMAMQNREFNRDDIESFKKKGVVGENNEGFLTILDQTQLTEDPKYGEFVRAKLIEENRDREILMERVIEMTPGLSEKDLAEVKKIMAQRNRDNAVAGEKYQTTDGEWVGK